MKASTVYLAADSGGSKTLWTLVTAEGEQVFECRTEGLGAIREGLLPVRETVKEAAVRIGNYGIPTGIHLSLGGPNTREVLAALQEVWRGIPVQVEREACGDSILYAAGFLDCSAVVMCGTGSTAVGNTEKGRCYAGGWGPIYGDGGSGGGLGSDALRLFLRSIDGLADVGGVASLFAAQTHGLDVRKFEDRMELKRRALQMSRRELAALAPSLYTLSVQGDATAQLLYRQAAMQVAEMAYSVSDNDANVLLCGGFFAEKPAFIEACREELAKKSRAKLHYNPTFSPIIGVQLTVLKTHSITITPAIAGRIFNNQQRH
ncbi:MAG: hypothetical protein E7541_05675 [Ruminococcaceae bacterium]|nr:hypothetical protein [Oscillospiraceae bacterium]